MTWIIGASSLFGYGAIISDVQVTLANKQTVDILQKAYPLGRFIAGGFAGSVSIGFRLVDSCRELLQLPPEFASSHAWDPAWVAKEWAPKAKAIFQSAEESEKKLGANFILVGISPNFNFSGVEIARVYVIRFASPSFSPGFLRRSMALCNIGTGSRIVAYKRAIKPLLEFRTAPLQIETAGMGWWAKSLAHSMSNAIVKSPHSGISRHLNVLAFNRSQIIRTNNDETIYYLGQPQPEIITMPPLASSYKEFLAMVNSLNLHATAATC